MDLGWIKLTFSSWFGLALISVIFILSIFIYKVVFWICYKYFKYNLGQPLLVVFGILILLLNGFFLNDELLLLRSCMGNADCQFRLGYVYSRGRGIIREDKIAALKQYQLAAAKNHPKAQLFLGYMYENGEGTEKDIDSAKFWYLRAAQNGDEVAKTRLKSLTK
jgi:TPR repeat protein